MNLRIGDATPPGLSHMASEMKRVVILGGSSSGKSTFARQLGATLEIPVFHLDTYFWQPGWVEPDPSEFERTVLNIIQRDTWIIEGNYRVTRDERLEASDTIIFLRESRWRCAFRFIWRCWFERSRPDLPEGCREPIFNKEMVAHLRIILTYQNDREPRLLQTARKYDGMKHIQELNGRRQVDTFLENVTAVSE